MNGSNPEGDTVQLQENPVPSGENETPPVAEADVTTNSESVPPNVQSQNGTLCCFRRLLGHPWILSNCLHCDAYLYVAFVALCVILFMFATSKILAWSFSHNSSTVNLVNTTTLSYLDNGTEPCDNSSVFTP